MRSQRRSQFKLDYCRGADRARQFTASFTRDRRRAHWHTTSISSTPYYSSFNSISCLNMPGIYTRVLFFISSFWSGNTQSSSSGGSTPSLLLFVHPVVLYVQQQLFKPRQEHQPVSSFFSSKCHFVKMIGKSVLSVSVRAPL